MSNDYLNRRDPIHINCPYCWAEFKNYKQIVGKIQYNNKMYESFEVFPLLIKEPHPFKNYTKKFSDDLVSISVECPECKRHYRIVLFPYNPKKNRSHEEYVLFNENDKTVFGDYTLLHKLGLVSEKTGKIRTLLDHYRRLIPYFIILFIFAILDLWLRNEYMSNLMALSLILFAFMGISLSLFQWQNKYSNNLKTINNLPFLIHENYKKSYSNIVFQKKLINGLGFCESPSSWIILLVSTLVLAMISAIKNGVIEKILSGDLIFIFFISLSLIFLLISVCIYYFIFAVIILSMTDYCFRIIYLLKNIPLRLDPWDKSYGIEKFTKIFFRVIIGNQLFVFIKKGK